MKRVIAFVIALVLVASSSQVYAKNIKRHHREKPPSVEQLQNINEFIDYKDIKRDAQGYGLTTFENNKVERFKVRFVGLYPFYGSVTNNRSLPGKYSTLILVKLVKPFVTVSGMSGSPVYFKGKDGKWKLAGGLGYGLSDNDLPINYNSNISGVTPIKYMLNQRKIFGAEKDNAKTSVKYYRPKPGEMVVFSMAEPNGGFGCTVTYVQGNHFWLCAHYIKRSENGKNLWLGKVNMPVYRANMMTTVKGKMASFKIMAEKTPRQYVGAVTYDNMYAIDGTLGAPAKLINLYVRIVKPTLKESDWQKLSVSPTVFSSDDLFDMTASHLFSYWPNETSTVIVKSTVKIGKRSFAMFAADLSSDKEKAPAAWKLMKKISEILGEGGNADWAMLMPSGAISVEIVPGNKFLRLAAKSISEDTNAKDSSNRHYNLLLELKNSDDSKAYGYEIPFTVPKEKAPLSVEIYSGDTNINPIIKKGSPFASLLIALGANEAQIDAKTKKDFIRSLEKIASHQKDERRIYVKITLEKQTGFKYSKFLAPIVLPEGYLIKDLDAVL